MPYKYSKAGTNKYYSKALREKYSLIDPFTKWARSDNSIEECRISSKKYINIARAYSISHAEGEDSYDF